MKHLAKIERIDRYTITINGYRVRADAAQERRIRAMDINQLDRFCAVMGVPQLPVDGVARLADAEQP